MAPGLNRDTPGSSAAVDDFGSPIALDHCGRPCPRFINPGSTQTHGPSGATYSETPGVPFRTRYNLRGPQVEPLASVWTREPCAVPCVVRIKELSIRTDDPSSPYFFPDFPSDAVSRLEVEELVELASLRDDPEALVSLQGDRERRQVSQLLQYRPQPLGAVFDLERDPLAGRLFGLPPATGDLHGLVLGRDYNPRFPVIRTGRELARYFESETPGLGHRHALNYLLQQTTLSAPRQAWIWATLDIAIYSALLAAWHYKWIAGSPGRGDCHDGLQRLRVSYRPRPWEFDNRVSVLFNREVDRVSFAGDGPRRSVPSPSPGTPRHPSYPSGHSTYSGAASELLSYFFPDYREELDQLADNAGMARLWAGIHYRSDHIHGARLGRAVARLIIEQIERSCIPRFPDCCPPSSCAAPPTPEELCRAAASLKKCCQHPAQPKDPFLPVGCPGDTPVRAAVFSAAAPDVAAEGPIAGPSSADPTAFAHDPEGTGRSEPPG